MSPCRQKSRNARRRLLLHRLSEFQPSVVAIPDLRSRGGNQTEHCEILVSVIQRYANTQRIKAFKVGPEGLRKAFPEPDAGNKQERAKIIASRFPELALCAPPDRRLGDSEHYRTGIFDAVALAFSVLQRTDGRDSWPPAGR